MKLLRFHCSLTSFVKTNIRLTASMLEPFFILCFIQEKCMCCGCVAKNSCFSSPFHFLASGGRQPKSNPGLQYTWRPFRQTHTKVTITQFQLQYSFTNTHIYSSRVATFVLPRHHSGLRAFGRLIHFLNTFSFSNTQPLSIFSIF